MVLDDTPLDGQDKDHLQHIHQDVEYSTEEFEPKEWSDWKKNKSDLL